MAMTLRLGVRLFLVVRVSSFSGVIPWILSVRLALWRRLVMLVLVFLGGDLALGVSVLVEVRRWVRAVLFFTLGMAALVWWRPRRVLVLGVLSNGYLALEGVFGTGVMAIVVRTWARGLALWMSVVGISIGVVRARRTVGTGLVNFVGRCR